MLAFIPPMLDPVFLLTLSGISSAVLAWAVWCNARTSLLHAASWALAAAVTWCVLGLSQVELASSNSPWFWIAFGMTAAPVVALLGARRPTVAAWNFVVVGFLATLLFPVLSNQLIGSDLATPFQFFFLGFTLLVGVVNYLPTRLMPAALLFAVGCSGLLLHDAVWPHTLSLDFHAACLLLSPAVGMMLLRGKRSADPFDDLWLRFRDRYGWLWAQRARDQFNHAARNAGWPVQLGWRGLVVERPATQEQRAEWLQTLRAVQKRFMDEENVDMQPPACRG